MADWQDDTTSSPVYALMREMADDEAPHLNGLPESHPDVQALRARCMEALKAGRRAAGSAKGVVTRKVNEAAREASTHEGRYPALTGGTARQTKWATDIRFKKIRYGLGWGGVLNRGLQALVEQRTTTSFWIETRDMPWERMVEKYGKRV